jgi:uncharacterized repeat protein (TIGR04076 family)
MSHGMAKCKITILKRTVNQDLIDEYLDDAYKNHGACECFQDGQEFMIDPTSLPEEFCACCPWAWADIRQDIMIVASGGNMPGIRPHGTIITACRDWFRPVYFKVERTEDAIT